MKTFKIFLFNLFFISFCSSSDHPLDSINQYNNPFPFLVQTLRSINPDLRLEDSNTVLEVSAYYLSFYPKLWQTNEELRVQNKRHYDDNVKLKNKNRRLQNTNNQLKSNNKKLKIGNNATYIRPKNSWTKKHR